MKGFNRTVFRQFATVLLACLFVAAGSRYACAQQVQSDYEIQKNFNRQVKQIQSSLDTLGSVKKAGELVREIKSLEKKYAEHETLLDKALYPETFDQQIEELKRRTVSVQQRLATIQYQSDKLDDLTQRLSSYSDQLERLNSRADSLRSAIAQSTQSEKRLSNRVRNYRESLEQRDRLILSIVDSVLVAYQEMDIESLNDLENARKQSRIDADGNPLKLIRGIASENVQFLGSNPTLATEDYLRMNAVQHEFRSMWDKTGKRLVEIYGSGNEEQIRTDIQNTIAEWDKKLKDELWASIHQSFGEAGVKLSDSTDSEAFYMALNSYLNQQVEKSKESNGNDAWQKYQNFSSFWNGQVKSRWTTFMTEGEVLTEQQIATIDQKMNQWSANARPESNMMAYLFGVSLLAAVVLGVMLFREKSNHS